MLIASDLSSSADRASRAQGTRVSTRAASRRCRRRGEPTLGEQAVAVELARAPSSSTRVPTQIRARPRCRQFRRVPRGSEPWQARRRRASTRSSRCTWPRAPAQVLRGPDIVVAAEKAGLAYGHMNMFHRLVDNHPERGPIFSVANMVKPGSFDMATIQELETPGDRFLPDPAGADGGAGCLGHACCRPRSAWPSCSTAWCSTRSATRSGRQRIATYPRRTARLRSPARSAAVDQTDALVSFRCR